MSGAELTEGVVVTLDRPPFRTERTDHRVLPDEVVAVRITDVEYLARVVAVDDSAGLSGRTMVKLEIPGFLPDDIDAWVTSGKRAKVGREAGAWFGRIVAVERGRFLRIPKVVSYTPVKPLVARKWAQMLEYDHYGGRVGARDRALALFCIVFGPDSMPARAAVIQDVIGGLPLDGGELFKLDEQLCRPENPSEKCSGLWIKAGELFSEEVADRRAHVVAGLKALGIVEAPGPWAGNRDKVYTLDDLGESELDNSGEEFSRALEAFLYVYARQRN